MTFAERMAIASCFEKQVIDRLNSTGWKAFPFGQALLPDECRDRLKRFEDGSRRPSLLRWMPDIITFRDFGGRSFVALIDAKACGERPNYAIESSAVESLEKWTDEYYTPSFFVFDDWRVLTPREARQRGSLGPDHNPAKGSGTPYVLVSKRYGRPFDEIFKPISIAK